MPYLTSTGMMDIDFLPEHLIVVGGSYIGLEFAQMYRRFGSRVTVVEMAPRIVAREDEDVSAGDPGDARRRRHRRSPQRRSACASSRRGDGVGVHVSCEQEPREIAGSHLLLAVGRDAQHRRPRTRPRPGSQPMRAATSTSTTSLRTNAPGIWALGDVNGRGAFTHTSYNDYEIVAANLLDGEPRRVSDRIPVYALFTDPPLARVGMTEREVARVGTPGARRAR